MTKANSINVKSAARLAATNSQTGRHGPFSKEQARAIESHFADWHDYAFVKHPNVGGRGTSGLLTTWKQNRAKLIMEGSEFTVLPEGHDYKQTLEAIVRKFTNWRNFKKKQNNDRVVENEALKNAAAVLMDFKTYTSRRDLFKQRKHSEIWEISSSVGAYQRAWKELWDEADQEEWEKMAQSELGKGVFENQDLFAPALLTGLRGLTQGGALGNLEMLVLYAHRDRSGRVISSLQVLINISASFADEFGSLEVHHDDHMEHFSNHSLGSDMDGFQLAYEGWCDRVLPEVERRPTESSPIVLPRATSGLPLFPKINLGDETPISLRRILQVYFESTWEHSHLGNRLPPWDEISASPSQFYDYSGLDLLITDPSKLSDPDAYIMASSLSRLPHPFTFRQDFSEKREGTPDGSARHDPEELSKAGDEKGGHITPESANKPSSLCGSSHASSSEVVGSAAPANGFSLSNDCSQSRLSPPDPLPHARRDSPSAPLSLEKSPAIQPTLGAQSPSSAASHHHLSTIDQLTSSAILPTSGATSLPLVVSSENPQSPSQVHRLRASVVPASESPSNNCPHSPPLPTSGATSPPLTASPEYPQSPPQVHQARASAFPVAAAATATRSLPDHPPHPPPIRTLLSSPPAPSEPSTVVQHPPTAPPEPSAVVHHSSPPPPIDRSISPAHKSSHIDVAQKPPQKRQRRPKQVRDKTNNRKPGTAGHNAESKRPSRAKRAAGRGDHSSTILPDGSVVASLKRTLIDLTGKSEVMLNDGRRGIFEPSKKHKGGWFCEIVAEGEPAAEKEWMNQDEIEENLQRS